MTPLLYVFLHLILMCGPLRSQTSDLQIIHQRIVNDLLEDPVDDNIITPILESITSAGNWLDIDYIDTSRTGFEHSEHLNRMVDLAKAYRQHNSAYYQNPEVKQTLMEALDYWLENDFICDNWWWNQIGTPDGLVKVVLLMENDLSDEQKDKAVEIIGRSNLQASGARPSGDRIKMAGILAKKLLIQGDEAKFDDVIKVIEGEIKFSEGRGMQVDYSFHHREDRVNNTLSYGLGYAQAFAEWAALVSGTRYKFSEGAVDQLVDYFLDGICKMSVYGKYPDPGAKNRSVSRAGTLKAFGVELIDHLLIATDYRGDELREIKAVRLGNQTNHRIFNKFFWQTEYMSHQRSGFFTSARMYSIRNQNMEYPYNSEGLKNHYLGDGANFISRTGKEYFDIFPVLDWRRIPGTTVVQKPQMPSEKEVREEGITNFVGGVSDGLSGAAAFDYVKSRDSLQARKSWFFFDDVYVCLGAGIKSASVFPVNTTVNQCLSNGDVYVANDDQIYPLHHNSQEDLKDIRWIWHDSIGYIFPGGQEIFVSNQIQNGSWYSISQQNNSPRETIGKEVFKLWVDHGVQPGNGGYSYLVVPAVSRTYIQNRDYLDFIKILSNNPALQAVQDRLHGRVQAVFYRDGILDITPGLRIEMKDPGMIMITYRNGEVTGVAVSDPTRRLQDLHFTLSQQLTLDTQNEKVELRWDSSRQQTSIRVSLPQDEWAGSSVIINF